MINEMDLLPSPLPGTALRILATTDLGAAFVPMRTSYGESGTCAGIAEVLERERVRQPTVWLDAGDLTFGPTHRLLGSRPWAEVAELPIAAAAAGNHDFDDGVPALLQAARSLPFPLLCANVDVSLPSNAMLGSERGQLGVIGLTHPYSHRSSQAPRLAEDWPKLIRELAKELRARGAHWVAVLLHDGASWWPSPDPHGEPIQARPDRLEALTGAWAESVDVILGGHTPGSWVGKLGGTPAGHAYLLASSVLVVDLLDPPSGAVVRGVFTVPGVKPTRPTPATEALDAAAARIVGESSHSWITRTDTGRYLPDLLAKALRTSTGADAALFLPGSHVTQAPLDGAIAVLPSGPISELDVLRLFDDDDRLVIVEIESGELRAAVDIYNAISDPHNREGDQVDWNWCRMPAAFTSSDHEPRTLAVMAWVLPLLSEWLGRELQSEPADMGARDALLEVLT
jgi:2',3'-cyclic-nucleotide 2'-phosphodiesterase (5'-nucleotidase family)